MEWIPPLKRYFDTFSHKIVFQDYELLVNQQQRLAEGANPWNQAIQVDELPLLYRTFWKRTFRDVGKGGVWWRGWKGSADIEDLDAIVGHCFDMDGCVRACSLHRSVSASLSIFVCATHQF